MLWRTSRVFVTRCVTGLDTCGPDRIKTEVRWNVLCSEREMPHSRGLGVQTSHEPNRILSEELKGAGGETAYMLGRKSQ